MSGVGKDPRALREAFGELPNDEPLTWDAVLEQAEQAKRAIDDFPALEEDLPATEDLHPKEVLPQTWDQVMRAASAAVMSMDRDAGDDTDIEDQENTRPAAHNAGAFQAQAPAKTKHVRVREGMVPNGRGGKQINKADHGAARKAATPTGGIVKKKDRQSVRAKNMRRASVGTHNLTPKNLAAYIYKRHYEKTGLRVQFRVLMKIYDWLTDLGVSYFEHARVILEVCDKKILRQKHLDALSKLSGELHEEA